mgnify:CR=1 FL=1
MDKLINDFSVGLFFWQSLLFIALILLLKKFAWGPILTAVEEREDGIKDALEAAEKAKIELSSAQQTDVNLPYVTADATGPKHMNVKVTRAKLESLVEDLVQRTLEPLKVAISDAGLSVSDINDIIDKGLHLFAGYIINYHAHSGSVWHVIVDCCLWIEWVGIVLFE